MVDDGWVCVGTSVGVMAPGDSVLAQLSIGSPVPRAQGPVVVRTLLTRITADGDALAEIVRGETVALLRDGEHAVVLDDVLPDYAPAWYRIRTVVTRSGEVLAEDEKYIAVPEQRVQVALSPVRQSARPGERFPFIIENVGPTPLTLGTDYNLSRHDPAGWTRVNVETGWELPEFMIPVGGRREDIALIPPDAPAGTYRISKAFKGVGTHVATTATTEILVD